jgi:hypothetical protein
MQTQQPSSSLPDQGMQQPQQSPMQTQQPPIMQEGFPFR